MQEVFRSYKYPNITAVFLGVIIALILINTGYTEVFINQLGALGYLGVFIVGFFFVSTFTVIPAAALMFIFAQTYDPWAVSIIGALGGVIADYFGYIFIRDRLFAELKPLLKSAHLYPRFNFVHSKYFGYLAPVVGAIIIASPLPDEPGLALLGTKKFNKWLFFSVVFLINIVGIYLITLAV